MAHNLSASKLIQGGVVQIVFDNVNNEMAIFELSLRYRIDIVQCCNISHVYHGGQDRCDQIMSSSICRKKLFAIFAFFNQEIHDSSG